MLDRLEDADRLLRMGLAVAQRNRDKRCAAFYKRSHAHYYIKKKDVREAIHWTQEAIDSFKRLGMQSEAEEMNELLRRIHAKLRGNLRA